MKRLEIHVDESTEAMAWRFIDAWHRAERGEAVEEHRRASSRSRATTSACTPMSRPWRQPG
jgi:hypothetical protein